MGLSRLARPVLLGLAGAALLLPLVVHDPYVLQTLANAWLYGMLALSLTLVAGTAFLVEQPLQLYAFVSDGTPPTKRAVPRRASAPCAPTFRPRCVPRSNAASRSISTSVTRAPPISRSTSSSPATSRPFPSARGVHP